MASPSEAGPSVAAKDGPLEAVPYAAGGPSEVSPSVAGSQEAASPLLVSP